MDLSAPSNAVVARMVAKGSGKMVARAARANVSVMMDTKVLKESAKRSTVTAKNVTKGMAMKMAATRQHPCPRYRRTVVARESMLARTVARERTVARAKMLAIIVERIVARAKMLARGRIVAMMFTTLRFR